MRGSVCFRATGQQQHQHQNINNTTTCHFSHWQSFLGHGIDSVTTNIRRILPVTQQLSAYEHGSEPPAAQHDQRNLARGERPYHTIPLALTDQLQFLEMLQPSYALIKRHQTDQHRLAAEIKLQNELDQFRQRIGRLEQHAQHSEVQRAALHQRLQTVEQERVVLHGRIQQLVNENTMLRRRIVALERDSADDVVSTSPETATPSATAVARDPETALTEALSGELDPTILHPMLPKLLFVVDPVRNTFSDGAEFPLSMLSSLRSILAKMVADDSASANQLAQLRNASDTALSIKRRCLYRYLKKSDDRRRCVWTKEDERFHACRTCVNKQRLCMRITEGHILVLPLHPLFRTIGRHDGSDTLPTELEYWIAARGMSTAKVPYNADIWAVPAGQQ